MAKFLFTVWPFAGHVNPDVAIAHALGGRGHQTAFYTGSSARASLEGEGFRCFPFRHVQEAREAIVLNLDALSLQWWKARRRKTLLREWLLETVEPHALAGCCAWLDGLTLHVATRAGARDPAGREANLT